MHSGGTNSLLTRLLHGAITMLIVVGCVQLTLRLLARMWPALVALGLAVAAAALGVGLAIRWWHRWR